MKSVLDAAKNMVSAAGVTRLYDEGSVPQNPGYPYTVLGVTAAGADTYLLSAQHGTRSWRVSVRSYGRTHASASDLDERARDGLLDRRPDVDGWQTGPFETEVQSALVRDPDENGVLGITSTYTTTGTKET